MTARQIPVSIICAFNDPDVRQRCLDRSIEEHSGEAAVEFLPIDNVDGAFASAGAALNHGASLASHDYLVFVHQDVYLHSLSALEAAAGTLADDQRIGLVGAIGVTADGGLVGRVRDRVLLLGEPVSAPTDVDSLDEVLFMLPRWLALRHPLSELAELAWHAYAVEYGLRVRSLGLRVCAVDIPLTHHSLTRGAALDVPYGAIAARYPDALPVRAPGGTVAAPARSRARTMLGSHGWRYSWLRNSAAAHAGRRAAGGGACVLSDIRSDIDDVMQHDPNSPLVVMNLDREPGFADEGRGSLELLRRGRSITLSSRAMPEMIDAIRAWTPRTSILLTNLGVADLRSLAPHLPPALRVMGFRREIGYWMLLGPAAATAPKQWRSVAATPLGMPAVAQ